MLSRGRRVWVVRAIAITAGAGAVGLFGWSAAYDANVRQPTRQVTRRPRASLPPLPAPRPHLVEPRAGANTGGVTARRPDARASAPAGGGEQLRRDVGQKIMARMAGTYPSRPLLRRVRRGQIGGVILFSDNVRTPAQLTRTVAALQDAAARGGNPPLLIAVDQEGGEVRRLSWAPPRRSAAQLGTSPITASRQGEAAARALRKAGINLDLAPVLDVPEVPASFLGSRTFGATADAVARAGCAFAKGLRRGHVLTAAKHFPGLGYANANTDLAPVTIDAPAERLRNDYRPYRECLNAGALSIVMVSSAAYPALGARLPAVLSRTIIGRELRGRLGFDGVVISDSLQSPAVQRVPGAATKAARAGVDILLYPTTEDASAAAFRALLAAARSRTALRHAISQSAQRIRALKDEAIR